MAVGTRRHRPCVLVLGIGVGSLSYVAAAALLPRGRSLTTLASIPTVAVRTEDRRASLIPSPPTGGSPERGARPPTRRGCSNGSRPRRSRPGTIRCGSSAIGRDRGAPLPRRGIVHAGHVHVHRDVVRVETQQGAGTGHRGGRDGRSAEAQPDGEGHRHDGLGNAILRSPSGRGSARRTITAPIAASGNVIVLCVRS